MVEWRTVGTASCGWQSSLGRSFESGLKEFFVYLTGSSNLLLAIYHFIREIARLVHQSAMHESAALLGRRATSGSGVTSRGFKIRYLKLLHSLGTSSRDFLKHHYVYNINYYYNVKSLFVATEKKWPRSRIQDNKTRLPSSREQLPNRVVCFPSGSKAVLWICILCLKPANDG